MLSHTIAMPATISTTAMMNNMAPLISTTKEFMESTRNSMTSGTQYQEEQQRGITSGKGGARNN
jgi:hypothetical protein